MKSKRILFSAVILLLVISTWQRTSLYSASVVRTVSVSNAVIPDFQVNDTGGPCGERQYSPRTAIDSNGNYIITWHDYRNGDNDIYARYYSSDGSAAGPSFKINDDAGSAKQFNPAICMDQDGNFIIAWRDGRNGDYDIYAQRYSSDGSEIGSNFKVNDDPGHAEQFASDICMNQTGNVVIAWHDDRNGNDDIYIQRFSADGSALGVNIMVNDDAGNTEHRYPSMAMDMDGNFIITWYDDRNGDWDVYFQRYSLDGSALGSNIKINDDQGNEIQLSPDVSADPDGNFIITWYDRRSGNYDIYAQSYSADGSAVDSNFKVNDDLGNMNQYHPAISVDPDGNFVITWYDYRNEDSDVYAQRYAADGSALGANFKVNDNEGNTTQRNPDIAIDQNGKYIILWYDDRHGDYDIYAQRYSADGSAVGSNFKVNDDQGSAEQSRSCIAAYSQGNFVIAWEDERLGNDDIYAQRYLADGSPAGAHFKVNDDPGDSDQREPSLAMDSDGNFMVTWYDNRNGNYDIYVQRYSSDGSTLGSNFQVNDDPESAQQYCPDVSADPEGNFVITWYDRRNGNYDIYAQRYSADGSALGVNFMVNDEQENKDEFHPDVSMDPEGNFIITWYDDNNEGWDVYARRYLADGSATGTNFKINDDQESANQYFPAVSTDNSGKFVITWFDERNQHDVYAQRCSADGSLIGSNFKVNENDCMEECEPCIATDSNGNFLITWWNENIGDWEVYGQRFLNDGSALGTSFRVTHTSVKNQYEPAVALVDGYIYSSWTDNRAGGSGYDIWANVLDWEDVTGIDENHLPQNPSSFLLRQNFPNPFNPSTTIRYDLSQASQVKVMVFNMQGQQVRVLENGIQSAGSYVVKWDGTNAYGKSVPSGIYLCRIHSEERQQTVKMMLVR